MHVASDGDLLQSRDFVASGWCMERRFIQSSLCMAELRVLQGPEYRYIRHQNLNYSHIVRTTRGPKFMEHDRRAYLDWVARMSIWNDKTPRFDSEMTTSDTRAALETLGYMTAPVQWQVHQTDGLPDPKTAPDIVHRFERVRLGSLARTIRGARILEAFLADYPRVVAARCCSRGLSSGRTREAHQVLTPILKTPKDKFLDSRWRVVDG